MTATPELVAAVQRDRERDIERDRRAAEAARMPACCSVTIVEALARALRLATPL